MATSSVTVDEARAPHRRRPRRDEPVREAPRPELHHRPAHQRVRGERVGPRRVALDHQHPRARPGEEQRRGRARRTRARDQHVIARGDARPSRRDPRPEEAGDGGGQRLGVAPDPVDEVGGAAALDAEPQHVEAGRGGDAAVVHDLALGVEHRHAQPPVVAGIPGRPDHRADALGREVEAARPALGMRRDLPGRRVLRCGDAGRGDMRVDPRQHAVQPRVGGRAIAGEAIAQREAHAVRALDAAGDADASGRQPREIDGPLAGQLHRRLPARRREVGHPVRALGGDAGGVHPGEDVAPAVASDHAHVAPGRQRHRPARGVDLLRQLQARGGAADHEHPAGGQVARPPVAERVHLDDAARKPCGETGPARAVAGAGRHHDGAGAPGAGVGVDAVAARDGGHRAHRGVGEDRRGRLRRHSRRGAR